MTFAFSLFSALFLLSLGSSAGCLICMLSGKIFHKSVLKSRFTIFCVLLSLAIAIFAFSLIVIPEMYASPAELLDMAGKNILFLCGLFACGLLCSVFWRSILPLAVSCFIALSVFTGIKLYGVFGANEEIFSLVVQNDAIKVNGQSYPVQSPQGKSLVIKKYTLPAALLVPLPRIWYEVCGVADTSTDSLFVSDITTLSHFSGDAERSVVFSGEGNEVFLGGFVQAYREWMLKKSSFQLIPLDDSSVYPSLYTVKIHAGEEVLSATLVRNL